jgi:hypothetical protein
MYDSLIMASEERTVPLSQHFYPNYVRRGKSPKNDKAGFISADGKIVIEPILEDARPFSEGLASAQLNEKWECPQRKVALAITNGHLRNFINSLV